MGCTPPLGFFSGLRGVSRGGSVCFWKRSSFASLRYLRAFWRYCGFFDFRVSVFAELICESGIRSKPWGLLRRLQRILVEEEENCLNRCLSSSWRGRDLPTRVFGTGLQISSLIRRNLPRCPLAFRVWIVVAFERPFFRNGIDLCLALCCSVLQNVVDLMSELLHLR